MTNENKNVFTMVNDRGEKLECEIIMTIDSEEYKKNYIVYTDHTIDENGNTRTFASIYDPTGKNLDLLPVTSDEEWNMIENVLASAQKKVYEEMCNKNEE